MANISQLKKEMEEAFGPLSVRQLWVLTKFAKHVRLRARNNAAFNNFANSMFPYARFQQVTKTRTSRITGQPESYPGLKIIVGEETSDTLNGDESDE